MEYVDRELIFDSDKIYFIREEKMFEVMMDWEDEIMKASADYICENGGDILEIGFGMGISAGYIQANNINSHTIIEKHPQIIKKLKAWAQDKPNVIIIKGDWYDVKNSLSTYDGIFFDTYEDFNDNYWKDTLPHLTKKGTRATWFNNGYNKDIYNIDGVKFDTISINPPPNSYLNSNTYYLPKKQF